MLYQNVSLNLFNLLNMTWLDIRLVSFISVLNESCATPFCQARTFKNTCQGTVANKLPLWLRFSTFSHKPLARMFKSMPHKYLCNVALLKVRGKRVNRGDGVQSVDFSAFIFCHMFEEKELKIDRLTGDSWTAANAGRQLLMPPTELSLKRCLWNQWETVNHRALNFKLHHSYPIVPFEWMFFPLKFTRDVGG